jgi:hypothetical protein
MINDDGNGGATPRVRVMCDGIERLNVDGIAVTTINFTTGNRNDNVQYNLLGALFLSPRNITGDLRRGNDTFRASIGGDLASGQLSLNVLGSDGNDTLTADVNRNLFGSARLDIAFDGGRGRDTLAVDATTDPTNLAGPGVDIGIVTSLNANLVGGRDRDTISLNYSGDLDGNLDLRGNGGGQQSDRDILTANVELDPSSGFFIPNFPVNPTPTAAILLAGRRSTLNANVQTQGLVNLTMNSLNGA